MKPEGWLLLAGAAGLGLYVYSKRATPATTPAAAKPAEPLPPPAPAPAPSPNPNPAPPLPAPSIPNPGDIVPLPPAFATLPGNVQAPQLPNLSNFHLMAPSDPGTFTKP
jgi:hypothetical protein